MSVPYGFSLSGDEKMFLPCYNAMIASALCRLGRHEDEQVLNAVNWINQYQPMERGIELKIPNLNFDRYGGCFKQTPCYINIAKSINALLQYRKASGSTLYDEKINQGIEYMLQHHLYKRLSSGKPITRNILTISFPESYHLNIVELINIISIAGKIADPRTADAIDYINSVKHADGWKVNYRYKAIGYTVFDQGRGVGNWVTYIINKALN